MRKILDAYGDPAQAVDDGLCEPRFAPERSQQLRARLRDFAARAGDGRLTVRSPAVSDDDMARGDGHFHLAPELFLQVAGWTRFALPHGELHLDAGEALLLPPRLRHAERVGASAEGEPFSNLVVYAEDAALSCHLAHEAEPGRPGILHLEARRGAQATRIHGWLSDAARIGGDSADAPWAAMQMRALVAAATAAVLGVLDAPDPAGRAEPALIARVRVLIQNQLGDPALSVRRLAEQSGCTPDYLSHLFRRTSGEHLAAHISRQRVERARHLLGDSTMAVKEIAWACGFATPSYFIRSFRAQFGVTPKAWRAARTVTP